MGIGCERCRRCVGGRRSQRRIPKRWCCCWGLLFIVRTSPDYVLTNTEHWKARGRVEASIEREVIYRGQALGRSR